MPAEAGIQPGASLEIFVSSVADSALCPSYGVPANARKCTSLPSKRRHRRIEAQGPHGSADTSSVRWVYQRERQRIELEVRHDKTAGSFTLTCRSPGQTHTDAFVTLRGFCEYLETLEDQLVADGWRLVDAPRLPRGGLKPDPRMPLLN